MTQVLKASSRVSRLCRECRVGSAVSAPRPSARSAAAGCGARPYPVTWPHHDRAGNTSSRLMEVIERRKSSTAEKSYTASLLAGGVQKIGAKIEEEAGETFEAAREVGEQGRQHLVHEAADLIYHLFVLLAHRDVSLA